MNKERVNNLIIIAKEALVKCEIADENGKINPTFRGQISSFGASVVMGSLPAAVAFFSAQSGASVERQRLISAIFYCIESYEQKKTENDGGQAPISVKDARYVLEYVCRENSYELKEKIIDASVALKLAMNFYDLKGDEDEKSKSDIQ